MVLALFEELVTVGRYRESEIDSIKGECTEMCVISIM